MLRPSRTRPYHHLDVAGGTGDIAFRTLAAGGPETHVTVLDINEAMLRVGAERAGHTYDGQIDQRAARIGDLLTVKVNVTDRANLNNETKRSRTNAEGFGLPNAFGLENSAGVAAAGISPDKLINGTSTSSSDGAGSVQRAETVTTSVAAVVTQVLPNGNLVVEGKQEIRIDLGVDAVRQMADAQRRQGPLGRRPVGRAGTGEGGQPAGAAHQDHVAHAEGEEGGVRLRHVGDSLCDRSARPCSASRSQTCTSRASQNCAASRRRWSSSWSPASSSSSPPTSTSRCWASSPCRSSR